MIRKKVLLIALISFVALFIGLTFACASKEPVSPDKAEATALYAEVTELRTKWLTTGTRDETVEPFGRAKAIYDLSTLYMDRGMYTEALPGLGQAKTYYTRFLQ